MNYLVVRNDGYTGCLYLVPAQSQRPALLFFDIDEIEVVEVPEISLESASLNCEAWRALIVTLNLEALHD
jgi:hypothetical protein